MAGGLDLGTLRGRIELDGQQAESTLQRVQDQAEKTTKSAEEIGNSMADAGGKIAGVGAVGIASLGGLLKVGSDLSAEIAGQQFLFKNLDKAVRESITTNSKLAEQIGLTEQQYLNNATSMATYYKNMGFTAQETSKLSGETMNLVADLGAVTDMPFDEAMDRFKSGLMGNYEALDAFGINVSASSLENSKFVKSLGKSWNQLSDNEKMMAVYNEVQRQGASASGLAKQEAEQFGMQLKLVKQQVLELAGKIGATLIPIVEPLLAKFKEIVEAVSKWVSENEELVGKILAVAGILSTLAVVVGGVLFVSGKLTALFGTLGLGISAIIPIIAALVGALVYLLGTNDELRAKVEQFATDFIQKMADTFTQLLEKLPEWFNLGLDMLLKLVEGMAQAVPNVLEMLFNILSTLLDTIIQNLPQWIEKGKEMLVSMIDGMKEKLPEMLTAVGEMILNVLEKIREKLPEFIQKGVEIVKQLATGIKNNLPEIMGKMVELLGKLIEKIVEYLPQFVMKGLEIVAELIVGLVGAIPDLLTAGKDLLTAVIDGVKEGLSKLPQIGKDIVSNILSGIKDGWSSITSWVGDKLSSLNPFGGKSKKGKSIDAPEGDNPEGDISPLGDGLGFGGGSLNPALLGASVRRSFRESVPKVASNLSGAVGSVQEAKETVIHTVVNLDGKQIAKASARYMDSELNALSQKSERLGGKVWA